MWPASLLAHLRSAPRFLDPGRKRRPQGRPRRAFVPRLEVLEDRTVPSLFTVTNLDDEGPGSLRQAVLDANGNSGADAIDFASGLTGTIGLTGGQLTITDALAIDGPGTRDGTGDRCRLRRALRALGGRNRRACRGSRAARRRARGQH